MDVSVYRTVGLGLVAENKPLNSKVIDFFPHEWSSMRDGEINSNPEVMDFKTKDATGTEIQGGVIAALAMQATWMPEGSNRVTAPDVRRGERVKIYQSADEDKYYWKPLGLDDNLRKKETIIFGISNTKDEGDAQLKPENMYWFEFSTHSKKLAFSSSKSDGEPYLYEMFFDFARGEFTLTDDIGNFIHLVSALALIHVQNNKGTFVKLDQKDIKMSAPQDINGTAGRDVVISAGRTMNLTAGLQAVVQVGGSSITLNPGNIQIKTPKLDGSV